MTSRPGPRVAVYAIALDEADNVESWAGAAAAADVMIIGDSGSHDDTVERLHSLLVLARHHPQRRADLIIAACSEFRRVPNRGATWPSGTSTKDAPGWLHGPLRGPGSASRIPMTTWRIQAHSTPTAPDQPVRKRTS